MKVFTRKHTKPWALCVRHFYLALFFWQATGPVHAEIQQTDAQLVFSTSVQETPCYPNLSLSAISDLPVQLPKVAASQFRKNTVSGMTFFSIKLNNEKVALACQQANSLSGIQFDVLSNPNSILGAVKNQATENAAKNIWVELILFNADWSKQYPINLQNKEPIDLTQILNTSSSKEEPKNNQINLAVRYTKSASTFEEVIPGVFYVVLPFVLKFN